VPYLARSDVEATVSALADWSAPGSVLVVNYQTPSLVATLGRRVAILAGRLFRVEPFTADDPWRSLWTPPDMAHLLAEHGFTTQGTSICSRSPRASALPPGTAGPSVTAAWPSPDSVADDRDGRVSRASDPQRIVLSRRGGTTWWVSPGGRTAPCAPRTVHPLLGLRVRGTATRSDSAVARKHDLLVGVAAVRADVRICRVAAIRSCRVAAIRSCRGAVGARPCPR